jgi:S-methylmethionine-dependent homocysteine/selenocysteine methylase
MHVGPAATSRTADVRLSIACGGALLQLAGQLAREAVQESRQEGVLIAGSLPPLQER